MDVEVFLIGESVQPDDVRGRTAIVIDVLRASTTIATALHSGARAVIPVADMAEAAKLIGNLDPASYRVGGERDGVPIDGYHFGNSPAEFSAAAVRDRTLVLLSTNGTGAIVRCAAAEELFVAGFVNVSLAVSHAQRAGRDVVIVCAGWRNRVSLEDTLCAGALLDRLWDGRLPENAADAAYIAWSQYRSDRDDLLGPILRCGHARRLAGLGYGADVPVCAEVDSIPLLPVLREGRLVAADGLGPDPGPTAG